MPFCFTGCCLVTGGTGLLGSHVARLLAQLPNVTVHVVDIQVIPLQIQKQRHFYHHLPLTCSSLTYNDARTSVQSKAVPEGVQLHVHSLTDYQAMEKLFEKIKPSKKCICHVIQAFSLCI